MTPKRTKNGPKKDKIRTATYQNNYEERERERERDSERSRERERERERERYENLLASWGFAQKTMFIIYTNTQDDVLRLAKLLTFACFEKLKKKKKGRGRKEEEGRSKA